MVHGREFLWPQRSFKVFSSGEAEFEIWAASGWDNLAVLEGSESAAFVLLLLRGFWLNINFIEHLFSLGMHI